MRAGSSSRCARQYEPFTCSLIKSSRSRSRRMGSPRATGGHGSRRRRDSPGSATARTELLEHMVGNGILVRDGGRLSLGPRCVRLYGFLNFAKLYSGLMTPRILNVILGSSV